MLMDHTLSNTSKDLALLWLYEEWQYGNEKSYATHVDILLNAALEALSSKSQVFIEFILNLPSITDSVLERINGLCDQEERQVACGVYCEHTDQLIGIVA
jgi:hypothetical protein